MLKFVLYTFERNAGLPRYLRDSAARMVSFARADGVCWFSVRTFARIAELSKSTAQRHLDELTQSKHGFASRRRIAGGGYEYKIDRRFLARGAVSHGRVSPVPRARPKEEVVKNKKNFGIRYEGELPDERALWPHRMRSWKKSGFWLPSYGPRPGEPGCLAPPD